MFNLIVGGTIDPMAAGLALAVGFVCICIFATTYIASRRSRRELDQRHALETMKERAAEALATRQSDQAHERGIAKLGFTREVELAQIADGTITSHSRMPENNGEG